MNEKIIQIIAKVLECDPTSLTLTSGLGRHYKWDSLGQVSIMVALEEHYGITVDDSNIEKLLTISQIISYLEANVAK